MSRGGQTKDRSVTERRCIASGETRPTAELVRFVIGPDGQVVPDLLGKLPGRGIWVTPDRDLIAKAVKKGLFARAAKTAVTAPDDLADRVEAGLVARVIDMISLARKAGQAVAGFEKVKSWLDGERARILIQASDGSGRGKNKLRSPPGKGSFIGILTAQELGLAFGRENVIHGALSAGGLTTRVVEEAARLTRMRKTIGIESAGKGTKTT